MGDDLDGRRTALVGPTHPAPGGIVHFTAGLAAALADRGPTLVVGWRRRFPARPYPGTPSDEVSDVAVTADGEAILDLLDPRTWRRAAQRIREFGAERVVLQWWHPLHAPVAIALQRMLRRHGIAVIMVCHNVEPHETNRLWRDLTRRALRGADALVVHAAALRPVAERLVPGVPVVTAFLPVFTNVAATTGRATADQIQGLRERVGASDRRLLLTFGYVRPYKGVQDAIAAMAHVRHDAVLLVAGECWEDSAAYERAAAAAGVVDRVALDFRYIPNDEIPALFAAADAVVLPYRTATQSAVAALAFAYDRPVVATRAGGLEELVQDGVTGALAPPGDPVGLAAAIDRTLAENRDWRPAIAEVRGRLSWARYAEILCSVCAYTPRRDPHTHAVLDRESRRAKASKIVWILERHRPLEGLRLLDIGTGSGTIARELARAVGTAGRVTGVDVADVRVELEGYDFVRFDGDRLPFGDGAFDVVVSNHVIEHVGDHDAQRRHVEEIARVLSPGGMAYVAAPHRWRIIENHYRLPLLSWLPRPIADRYVARTGRGAGYDCLLVTRRGLARMMRRVGLRPSDATGELVDATLATRPRAWALARPLAHALARGLGAPTIAVIGRRPPS